MSAFYHLNAFEASTPHSPEAKRVSRGIVEKHGDKRFEPLKVAREDRNRTRGVNQDLADRQHVVAGFRLADCVLRGADSLVGESLKPRIRAKKLRAVVFCSKMNRMVRGPVVGTT
jgi:hypothetical protein